MLSQKFYTEIEAKLPFKSLHFFRQKFFFKNISFDVPDRIFLQRCKQKKNGAKKFVVFSLKIYLVY